MDEVRFFIRCGLLTPPSCYTSHFCCYFWVACVICSLFCSVYSDVTLPYLPFSAPLHFVLFRHSWFCEALFASGFLLLTEDSYSHVLRHIKSFPRIFRCLLFTLIQNKHSLSLYTFSSTYICSCFLKLLFILFSQAWRHVRTS
jgi:hypothetical protein